jgi:hypothetical protein
MAVVKAKAEFGEQMSHKWDYVCHMIESPKGGFKLSVCSLLRNGKVDLQVGKL